MCVVLKRAVCAYAKAVAVATPTTLVSSRSARVGSVSTYAGSARFLCACRRAQGASAKTLRCCAHENLQSSWGGQNLEQAAWNSLQLTSVPVRGMDLDECCGPSYKVCGREQEQALMVITHPPLLLPRPAPHVRGDPSAVSPSSVRECVLLCTLCRTYSHTQVMHHHAMLLRQTLTQTLHVDQGRHPSCAL